MDKANFNGWTALVIIVALLLGYLFAWVNMRMLAPTLATQVSGQAQLIQTIDRNFTEYNQVIQKRLNALETKMGVQK